MAVTGKNDERHRHTRISLHDDPNDNEGVCKTPTEKECHLPVVSLREHGAMWRC